MSMAYDTFGESLLEFTTFLLFDVVLKLKKPLIRLAFNVVHEVYNGIRL